MISSARETKPTQKNAGIMCVYVCTRECNDAPGAESFGTCHPAVSCRLDLMGVRARSPRHVTNKTLAQHVEKEVGR